jgi:hypothetical protein
MVKLNYYKYNLITWKPNLNSINFDNKYLVPEFANSKNTIHYNEIKKVNLNNLSDKYERINMEYCMQTQPIIKLSKQLEYLKMDSYYNFTINLPENLLVIFFGREFNELIKYPNKIFYIEYGEKFNQPIDNLPLSLEFLRLGKSFNQPLENLPLKLSSLDLSKCEKFNYLLDYLPNNLKYLGSILNNSLDNLPNSLNELVLTTENDNNTNELFKLSIKKELNIIDEIDLEKKTKIYSENMSGNILIIKNIKIIKLNNLPKNIEYLFLSLKKDIKTEIDIFPENLKYLNLGVNYTYPIDDLINLKYLNIVVLPFPNSYCIDLFSNTKSDKLYVKRRNTITKFKNKNFKKKYFNRLFGTIK